MALDLTKTAKQVDFGDASYTALLGNLQANILKSHGRNHARHLFIRFTGSPAAVRAWIKTKVAPNVTTARHQRDQSKSRADAEAAGNKIFDGGLVTGFFLSAAGYTFLGFDAGKLPSKAFRKGMKDQNRFIGPEIALGINLKLKNRDPEPAHWEPGFQGEIHALITLADDKVGGNLTRLLSRVDQHKTEIAAGVGVVTHVQDGSVLRRPIFSEPGRSEPIEHFGYFDGISQPVFSGKDLKRYYDEDQKRQPQPGDWDPSASLDLVLAKDPFTNAPDAYGSFFVYRKLEQDYDLFHQRAKSLAAAVSITGQLAGAFVVGRFEDGTPISLAGAPDGKAPENHFMHAKDKDGLKCPMHAHVRKANPRGTTPGTSLKDEAARRIARRAIPYGKPHPDLKCDETEFPSAKPGPRGLLFMCFQSNIEDHFEFIQRVWIDNNDFPSGTIPFFEKDTGDDPLIGQDEAEPQHWPKRWNDKAAGTKKHDFEAAVTLKGGEYFFAPSKPFLNAL
ncbi:MAG: peroxidase [Sphingomonas sp.]|nr:peroxidase [Sphingomonas sp.]